MICDAHVHVGYFNCCKCGGVAYYSPRRIVGVLNRCCVDEFVFSSTTAQVEGIHVADVIREAKEVKRLAGKRAHPFLWLSWQFYCEDPGLYVLEEGLFEGVKLHETEGRWVQSHRYELERILNRVEGLGMPVQFHSGPDEYCRPAVLMKVADWHPNVRFDFAHCRPMGEMAAVIAKRKNVWTDTAYFSSDDFPRLNDYEWDGRLMFGSDLPAWQAATDCSLTQWYRSCVRWATKERKSWRDSFYKYLYG